MEGAGIEPEGAWIGRPHPDQPVRKSGKPHLRLLLSPIRIVAASVVSARLRAQGTSQAVRSLLTVNISASSAITAERDGRPKVCRIDKEKWGQNLGAKTFLAFWFDGSEQLSRPRSHCHFTGLVPVRVQPSVHRLFNVGLPFWLEIALV